MLSCRVRLNEQSTVIEALRTVQSDYMDALAHQTFSLAQVHNMLQLGTSALFNTGVSIQRINDLQQEGVSEVLFRFDDGQDPTEVCGYSARVNCRNHANKHLVRHHG
jgi:hypothetical protein